MKRVSLYLFIAASIAELTAQLFSLPEVRLVSKPILLPLLALYYFLTIRENKIPVSNVLLLALVFSWGGDVLLMGEGELFFIFGLVSFLVSHLLYIFTFRQFCLEEDSEALHGLQKLRFAFPIVLYGTGLVVILLPHLGDMTTPVIVYALVLSLMALNALFRFKRTSPGSFTLVFAGAILFMISDSILAINKFLEPVAQGGFWIMSTYIAAQFLIVQGLISHDRSK
ncbi:MAG: lysoplasmalogenase [Cyclobacteriaceae bacterium]|jgi:uncharacterized membrane protein YhhN|nr:lysoplasmalogenase [Cyclobacteriaceae bacterium]